MAIITGTDTNDFLLGTTEDDSIDGAGGFDFLSYEFANSADGVNGVTVDLGITTAQNVGADQGSDTLVNVEGVIGSAFADTLTGDAGFNFLDGGSGNDVIQGAGGDDQLLGGSGSDSFKYSFTTKQSQVQESFTGWLAEQGLSLECANQGFFSSKYTAYLQHLVDEYGIGEDLNGDGKIKIKINQNDPSGVPSVEGLSREAADAMFDDPTSVLVRTGHKHGNDDDRGHRNGNDDDHDHGHGRHEDDDHEHHHDHTKLRWFSDSFTIDAGPETVTSTDGHDLIFDFTLGEDTLDFSGLGAMSRADLEATFSVTQVDTNTDGTMDDTVIALTGDTAWSVTLVGVAGHADAGIYDAIKVA